MGRETRWRVVKGAALGLALLLPTAGPVRAEVYVLTGQVHPRFNLEIGINGQHLKTVQPNPGKAKIFIKQIRPGIVRTGRNRLDVTYRVLSEAAGGGAPVPSFKIRLVRKASLRDRSRGERLLELRGPRKPYSRSFTPKTVTKVFEVR